MDAPDFFYCARFRCIMLKIRCVQRQDRKHSGLGFENRMNSFAFFPECQKCEQGLIIRDELELRGAQIENVPPFVPDMPSLHPPFME